MSFLYNEKMFLKRLRKQLKLVAASYKIKLLTPFLEQGNILDVGTGNGGLEAVLKSKRFNIQGLDIKNKSLFGDIVPDIYDGENFPYDKDAFKNSMIVTVLHHTTNPEKILSEAKRCSGRILIVEDIYTNTFQKYLTFFTDSLVNMEFIGHPHSNKTDMEWRSLFRKMNLKLIYTKQFRFMLFFRQVIYVLEK